MQEIINIVSDLIIQYISVTKYNTKKNGNVFGKLKRKNYYNRLYKIVSEKLFCQM